MLALTYDRNILAVALVKAAGGRPSVATSPLALIHLDDVEAPHLPGPGWQVVYPQVSGICGSDIAAITGHASLHLDPLTSFPVIPGHELSSRLQDGTPGTRPPELGHARPGRDPPLRT